MQTAHEHPIHREDIPLSVEALELALHDACQRAVLRASSLALALGFYRSVLALAAGLRIARADNGLPLALDADLIASISARSHDLPADEHPAAPGCRSARADGALGEGGHAGAAARGKAAGRAQAP